MLNCRTINLEKNFYHHLKKGYEEKKHDEKSFQM